MPTPPTNLPLGLGLETNRITRVTLGLKPLPEGNLFDLLEHD
jgi:hypothetical protein